MLFFFSFFLNGLKFNGIWASTIMFRHSLLPKRVKARLSEILREREKESEREREIRQIHISVGPLVGSLAGQLIYQLVPWLIIDVYFCHYCCCCYFVSAVEIADIHYDAHCVNFGGIIFLLASIKSSIRSEAR